MSLWVTGTALLFTTLVGIPLGSWLGLTRSAGQGMDAVRTMANEQLAHTSVPTQKVIGEFSKDEFGQPLFVPDSEDWQAPSKRPQRSERCRALDQCLAPGGKQQCLI